MESMREWKDGRSKDITFIVTKDCQLACKYCYLVGKNSNERMSWRIAKQTIDFILAKEYDELFNFQSVVFNFIGGEPFLEIDLIDKMCDYLKMRMYELNHHWFNSYRFSITTNGINYDSSKVQDFIKKNIKHLSLTITIDGTKRKHDINRVWRNSANANVYRGSYDIVVRNIPLWLEQFPYAATKVTISSPDLPYICESVLHLFSIGIHYVHINCVFEDVWKEGDDQLLEQQMNLLADEIISRRLYRHYDCTLFERSVGHPMDAKRDRNWCGAGLMLAIDARGNLYPCTRFAKYSLRNKQERFVGNIVQGINKDIIRPFQNLSRSIQSTKECFECEVATGCAWCQGENYDCSESGTIFHRSTAICKMHKARVRANNYYWAKIDEIEGSQPEEKPKIIDNKCRLDKTVTKPDTIIVLLSTRSTPFCLSGELSFSSSCDNEEMLLPLEDLHKVVEKVQNREWKVQFVYPDNKLPEEYYELINSIPHHDIVPHEAHRNGDAVVLKSWDELTLSSAQGDFHILITTLGDFYSKVESLGALLCHTDRLNIVFSDEKDFSFDEVDKYKETLNKLSAIILGQWKNGHQVHVNLITDRLHLTEMSNCDAGWKSVTLVPNGKFYICPAFYHTDESNDCGSIDTYIDIKDPLLYKLNHAPLCRDCNAYHCQRCVFLNKQKTIEVNIPSYEQCKKAEIELEVTKQFYEIWKNNQHA